MVPAVSITLFILSLYSLVVFLLSLGLSRLAKMTLPDCLKHEPVTLIIPFRDEQDGIQDLAGDLINQTYPADLMRVIFVNDHSQDSSRELLESMILNHPGYVCLDLPGERAGKKEAIACGMEYAKSEWIIQLDADCRVGPGFVASHMGFREKYQPDLVAGLVTTREEGRGFLESLDRLDLLGLVGTGAGSFYYRRAVMCSGANLAYSRELYLETRSYDPGKAVASGDDMFLMIGARKLGKKLCQLVAWEAIVSTGSARTLGEFIRQRIRWGSKTVHYGMPDIQLLALLVTATNMLVLLLPIFIFIFPGAWPWLMSSFLLKTAADFAVLYTVTGYTGQKKSLWMFLPVTLVHYISQLVILAGSLVARSTWKGR